jgi:hypothetical protein
MIKKFINKLIAKSGGSSSTGKARFGRRQEVAPRCKNDRPGR